MTTHVANPLLSVDLKSATSGLAHRQLGRKKKNKPGQSFEVSNLIEQTARPTEITTADNDMVATLLGESREEDWVVESNGPIA